MPIRILSRNGYDHLSPISRGPRERTDTISFKKSISSPSSRIPRWIPWAAGAVGAIAILYGLFQLESVRSVVGDAAETISDFVMGDEISEKSPSSLDFDDEPDYDSGNFDASLGEELQSRF